MTTQLNAPFGLYTSAGTQIAVQNFHVESLFFAVWDWICLFIIITMELKDRWERSVKDPNFDQAQLLLWRRSFYPALAL
jgi:hypothetical protein